LRRLILEEPLSKAAAASRRVAVFAVLVALAAILAARAEGGQDALGPLAAFATAMILAGIALLLAGAAAVEIWNTGRRGIAPSVTGAALALGLLGYPVYLAVEAERLPRLSQATTDYRKPPVFMISSRAREARGTWTPPPPNPDDEALQRAAWPRVAPLLVDLEPDQAYRMSLRIAKDLGWKVVDATGPNLRGEAEAHIDATDRSLFFGFWSDIAIRIRPQGAKTQIDLRSVSRVGAHDFGANARRILKFAAAVQASTEAR
jgi:uncharacterized protein (DUF1499 family)